MAARGTEEKIKVTEGILAAFPGSFIYDKEIRVPAGGIQIKVTLTAAKDNVDPNGGSAVTGNAFDDFSDTPSTAIIAEPSAEEIAAVNDLISSLGL